MASDVVITSIKEEEHMTKSPIKKLCLSNKKLRSGLRLSELALATVIIVCTTSIIAMIAVVCASSTNMYKSIRTSVDETIERSSIDAAAHMHADVTGASLAGRYMSERISRAVSTPRIPTAEENASFMIYQQPPDEVTGETMDVLTCDGSVDGAPTQVIYHVEGMSQSDIDDLLERYYWRTVQMGPTLSSVVDTWSTHSIFQTYCIIDDFALFYPYFPLHTIYVDFWSYEFLQATRPENTTANETEWAVPYRDDVTGDWVISFFHPMYGNVDDGTTLLGAEPQKRYIGACGVDMLIGDIMAYVDTVSQSLPWGAYVVATAQDGSVIAVPEVGTRDWGVPDAYATFSEFVNTQDYVASDWNVFNSEHLSGIGDACKDVKVGGTANVQLEKLPGGNRLVSCSIVDATGWYVLAVIDEHEATQSQRRSLILVIVVVAAFGLILVLAGATLAVYVVVRRQYAKMNNKIHDLSTQLGEAQKQLADYNNEESALVNALSGNMRDVIDTLSTLKQLATQQQRSTIHQIMMLLIHREVATIRVRGEMTDEQRQFVMDCGMNIQEDNESTTDAYSIVTDQIYGNEHNAQSEGATDFATTTPTVMLLCKDVVGQQCEYDNEELNIESWSFDIFSAMDVVGKTGILQSVAITALTKYGLLMNDHGCDVTSTSMLSTQQQHMNNSSSSSSSSIKIDKQCILHFLQHVEKTYCGMSDDKFECVSGVVGRAVHTALEEHGGEATMLYSDVEQTAWNSYHNNIHAADVTQAMCHFLSVAMKDSPQFRDSLTPMDIASCILAAVIHDYGHPGRNGVYLKNTMAEIHVFFGGESPLERMHIARALKILLRGGDEFSALWNMENTAIEELRANVSSIVLATDMARHGEILGAFEAWSASRKNGERSPFDTRTKLLVLQMLIKAADISNAYRPWRMCHEWTMLLSREFREQGRAELEKCMIPSKFMDGSISPARMQETFIPTLVIPMLRAIAHVFPSFSVYVDMTMENLAQWREVTQNEQRPHTSTSSQHYQFSNVVVQ